MKTNITVEKAYFNKESMVFNITMGMREEKMIISTYAVRYNSKGYLEKDKKNKTKLPNKYHWFVKIGHRKSIPMREDLILSLMK